MGRSKDRRKNTDEKTIKRTQDIPEDRTAMPREKIVIGKNNRRKVLLACILVFIVSFMAYVNTLKGDFIWDDEYLILNNSQIKDFSHIGNVFKTYVGYGSENINNFYRPVQEISNMIDYYLWGEHAFGFHFTNIALHAFVSVLVCILLFYLSGDLLIAGIAALLYAVHPVHTEAIAYIAGRADPLYAVFMLLSMVFFVKFADSMRRGKIRLMKYVLSVLFFLISLLSKEIVILMPVLVFLYVYYFVHEKEDIKAYAKLKWVWVPYAAIAAFYAWLRVTVLSFSDIAPQSIFVKVPLIYRLVTFFRTIIIYFKLLIMPVGLHMERAIPITHNLLEPSAMVSIAFVALLGWLIYRTYNTNRMVSFGLAWFFANLLPVCNIVPINSFLAEHWIYMASVGLFLIASMGMVWIYRHIPANPRILRFLGLIGIFFIIGVYSHMTVIRNLDWKDEETFFRSTLKYHPNNARLYLNLGNTYYEKGQIDKAIEQYKKSLEINTDYAVAYGNIGSALLRKGDPVQAEEYLIKAVNIKDNYPIAHYNLGIIYMEKRQFKEAEAELKKATSQLPQLFQAWNMLGRTYLNQGRLEEAKTAFQTSLGIMPSQGSITETLKKIEEIEKRQPKN